MAAPTITGSRKDTVRITVTIAGKSWGTWETKSGGKTSGNGQSYFPGAMQAEKPLGGRPTTDNIVLVRNYDRVRDLPRKGELYAALKDGALCVYKEQPLDVDGSAYGDPTSWNCTLDAISPPDWDSSSTDSAQIGIELKPIGLPSA